MRSHCIMQYVTEDLLCFVEEIKIPLKSETFVVGSMDLFCGLGVKCYRHMKNCCPSKALLVLHQC